MRQVKKEKAVVVTEVVYRATVDLTKAEAAILFKVLNRPARIAAKSIGYEDGWDTRLDHAHHELWRKFFEYSDMNNLEATTILETY